MTLTNDQSQALEKLQDFYNDKEQRQIALTGGAGVGKSYLLAYFIQEYTMISKTVMAAPTHKARGVIEAFTDEYNLNVKTLTISALLGLKPIVNAKGKRYYGIETSLPQGTTSKLPQDSCVLSIRRKLSADPHLLIVDEASMVKDFEYYLLVYCAKKLRCKILWCGDEYQLPPIQKHRPVEKSKPFRDANIEKLELLEVVRYKGKVLELCNATRNTLRQGKLQVPDYSHFYLRREIISKSLPYFAENKDVQIIAWLNRTVDYYNDDIRERLFGEIAEEFSVLPNERIVLSKSHIVKNVTLPTGTSVYVKSVGCCLEKLPTQELQRDFDILAKALNLDKEVLPDNFNFNLLVAVTPKGVVLELYYLHETQKRKWSEFLKQLRFDINSYSKTNEGKNKLKLRGLWKSYFAMQDFPCTFSYGYAITADKSQGSSYNTVFVDARDILCKLNTQTLKRFYVAISRTKHELFIK